MKKKEKWFQFLHSIKILYLFLVISFIACVLGACGEQQEEEIPTIIPQEVTGGAKTLRSAEIYISGDWLYYCDVERDGKLYAHNMKTKEEIEVSDQKGYPYKTSHGFFYIINDSLSEMVYEVEEFELHLLCTLSGNEEFIDCVGGKVYWAARRQIGQSVVRQYLYTWDVDSGESVEKDFSELIYDISSGTAYIGNIVITDGGIYLGQSNGVQVLDLASGETQCIFENDTLSMNSDGHYVWFEGRGEGMAYNYYLVYPEDHRVQEMDCGFGFAVREDVFYCFGSPVTAYDLKEGGYISLPSDGSILSHQAYTKAELCGDYVVLRHGYVYYICLYNMQTGTMERILPEG